MTKVLSTSFFTSEGLNITLNDGKYINILSKKKLKQMKKEAKLIDKWYPKGELTETEKSFKGAFSSVHDFQRLIARFRKGDVHIYKEGNDLYITRNE